VDYPEGSSVDVEMHDGSIIRLRKLDNGYDPTDRFAAMHLLEEAHQKQEFITGLIYVNEARPSLPELERLPATPLALLPPEQVRPSREALERVLARM
jgi:2-oxoglutarate ferredoxin oxidoreductase subunit beta